MSSVVVNGETYIQTKATRTSWLTALQIFGACTLIILWVGYYAEKSITSAFNFEGIPSDGPFQLLNPLRRMAAGQTEGVDFQFFHGIGIPYLHYPLYWLFGKTFAASELSRYLVSLLCSVGALAVFASAVTKKAKRALFFTAIVICFYALTDPLNFFQIPLWGHDYGMVNPRVSLMGVRSTFPLIVFAIFISNIRVIPKAIFLGLAMAMSLYLGIDHGMAVTGAFAAVTALAIVQSIAMKTPIRHILKSQADKPNAWKENIVFAATALVVCVVGILLLYVITCGFHGAREALIYSFREVPSDQFWYFGVPPNNFLGDGKIDFSHPYLKKWLAIFFFSVIVFLAFLVRSARHYPIRVSEGSDRNSSLFIMTYGMVACLSGLGYFNAGYFNHLPRLLLLILLLYAFRNNWVTRAQKYIDARPDYRMAGWGSRAIAATLFVLAILFITAQVLQESAQIGLIAGRTPKMKLSGGWMKYMNTAVAAVESHRQNPNAPPVIWSTYANLLEDRYQIFNPSDDYIIHALGPARRDRYLQRFRDVKPEFVQTMREDISTVSMYPMILWQYEEWLRTTTWPFYEDILNNYDVIAVTTHSVIWHRRNNSWVTAESNWESLPASEGMTKIDIPSRFTDDKQTLVIVKLQYEIKNPWQKLPVFGGMPRYLISPKNAETELAVSLPPYRKEIEFPVIVKAGQPLSFSFDTISLLPGATFNINSIAVKRLKINENQTPFLQK